MSDDSLTQTQDEPIDDPREQTASGTDEYDLPIDLYAGAIILIMGVLVLVTPLFTDMLSDAPWRPTSMNLISGTIYVLVGLVLLRRAGRL
ncbi:hypothetical protein JMJ58_22845 (plasmid) [Haloterrigena salifodinae]|uniref:Uncharacterized protein n=1 Tax=Haloterrigena salifodinae TaxID=2675099 RepID=A0A8T8E7E8_9EURY|nr:hypothetical protein [Haloterrigena salifodinae]QRV17648.1 hypothetical protein JMJ58_22845 [Haloterrigena salifodinae]